MISIVAASKGAGCTIIDAWRPLNAPRSSITIFPLRVADFFGGRAQHTDRYADLIGDFWPAIAAPTDIAAMRLCPQA